MPGYKHYGEKVGGMTIKF